MTTKQRRPPVEEQQVHPVPLIADAKPPLPAHEAEIPAQLQEKCLQAVNQRFFKVAFRVLVLEIEEFEDERVLDLLFGEDAILGPRLPASGEHGGLVL